MRAVTRFCGCLVTRGTWKLSPQVLPMWSAGRVVGQEPTQNLWKVAVWPVVTEMGRRDGIVVVVAVWPGGGAVLWGLSGVYWDVSGSSDWDWMQGSGVGSLPLGKRGKQEERWFE